MSDNPSNGHASLNAPHFSALDQYKPYDLAALKTYDLSSRPSKVFHDDLGQPVDAVAAHNGAENDIGLGWALGRHLDEMDCPHNESSLVLAAYRAGIPCTIHVALGTDIVHMHPHVSGAAVGAASLTDFRRLCSVVATMAHGVWMNLGSAVIMPEVFVKAVSVANNFGHNLDGLVTVNLDKQAQYRSRVNVLERPSSEGIELIGNHEIMLPLLHLAVTCQLAKRVPVETTAAA